MFKTGDPVEVATEDLPELVFDARGTIVHANLAQDAATVRLEDGDVQMYRLHQVRVAAG